MTLAWVSRGRGRRISNALQKHSIAQDAGIKSTSFDDELLRNTTIAGAPAELFPGWVKNIVSRPGWVKIEEFCCIGGSKFQISSVYMVKIRKFAEPGWSSDPV